jgi:transcriptional regulator with XRE-family HTH domain
MADIIRFPRRKRHARISSEVASGKSWKSSAVISPFEKSLSLLMVDQSGRTLPRRMRLTVTRETSIDPATSSSDKPREVMKAARCVMPDLYAKRTSHVNPDCTSAVLYGGNLPVHATYMPPAKTKKVIPRFKEPRLRPTFIKAWRLKKGLTQQQLADRVSNYLAERGNDAGYTHASVGRLENGKIGYTQPILEAIADALETDPASLLIRDPTDPKMWSIWERALPGEREIIADQAEIVIRNRRKTG